MTPPHHIWINLIQHVVYEHFACTLDDTMPGCHMFRISFCTLFYSRKVSGSSHGRCQTDIRACSAHNQLPDPYPLPALTPITLHVILTPSASICEPLRQPSLCSIRPSLSIKVRAASTRCDADACIVAACPSKCTYNYQHRGVAAACVHALPTLLLSVTFCIPQPSSEQ